jgi:hypothetical protein
MLEWLHRPRRVRGNADRRDWKSILVLLPLLAPKRGRAARHAPKRFLPRLDRLEARLAPAGAQPTFERFDPAGITPSDSAAPVGFTPDQIRSAYGINSIAFGAQAGDGSGQTIAIVDAYNDPNALSELDGFDSTVKLTTSSSATLLQQYGAAASFLSVFNQNGNNITSSIGTSGQNGVPAVDPTTPGPGADDWEAEEALDLEWAHAIAPGAKIDLVEANSPSNTDLIATAVATAAGLPGVSVVSMSFTEGESSGQTSLDSTFTTPNGHQGVTFVASAGDDGWPGGYPAYSPNVLAVGGTTLVLNADNTIRSEVAWSQGSDTQNKQLATGGGTSQFETEPPYQDGVQITGLRTMPDVAFVADPNTGVTLFDSYNNGTSTPWQQIGGTSLSAPSWAALIAIANQGRVQANGTTLDSSTNSTQTIGYLYALPSSDFHDINQGNNGKFSAGPGYDEVTGLGTPVANLLVPDLASYAPIPSQFAITAQPPSYVTNGHTFSVTVQAVDRADNLATSFNGNVTVSLAGTPGATLGGTLTMTAVNGSATFSNLSVNNPGSAYTLEFQATLNGRVQSTQSVSFNVVNDLEVINTKDTTQAGSLRAAVLQANQDAAQGTADTITFAPTLNGATIVLSLGQLEFTTGTATTTIDGVGQINISGDHTTRILQIDNGAQVVLNGITIEAGMISTGNGGAISNAGTLTVSDSTLTGNDAAQGGAIENNSSGTLTVSDSTFVGNTQALANQGTLTLSSCTISSNSATQGAGGIDNSGTLTLENTIVSGNVTVDPSTGPDLDGSITTDKGNNLLGSAAHNSTNDPQPGPQDVFSDTPGLAPLGSYGGPTQTMALLPDSPAIGTGTNSAGITADQRGLRRPTTNPDIGAFQSTPLVVTTTADPNLALPLGTQLPLRLALVLANADVGAGFSPTIAFAPGLSGDTIPLALGQLELMAGAGTTTIDGGSKIALSGSQASRVFLVDANAQAVLTGLTIQNGNAAGATSSGGGIENLGMLTVNDSTITNNSAGYEGGGISNWGTLSLNNSTVSGNTANDGGGLDNGGFDIPNGFLPHPAAMTVTNSTISNNTALLLAVPGGYRGGYGGGIDVEANGSTLTLNNVSVTGNTASVGGGGIFNTATATLGNVALHGNSAGSGGGVENSSGQLTVSNSTVSNNSAGANGGGVENSSGQLTVSNSTLADNSAAADGGGIYNLSGTVTIGNSTISGSSAGTVGGGIDNLAGTVTLNASTISGNTATNNDGGIANTSAATLTLSNATVSGNAGGTVGGIGNLGTLTLSCSTVSGNSGQLCGGIQNLHTLTLQDTIVSANQDTAASGTPDMEGAITNDNGYNLLGTAVNNTSNDPTPGSHDVFTDTPLLAPLSNYGGPTQTLALLPGSLAIGGGSNLLAVDGQGNPLTIDQRGEPRVVSGTVDIGAFESQPAPLVLTQPASSTIIYGALGTITATAGGAPAPTVQWEVSTNGGATFAPVSNGTQYSGVTTNTLTITGATVAQSGAEYAAVFSNTFGTATTQAAVLTINQATPTLTVSDGGTYNGMPLLASALIAGVTGPAQGTLESVGPTFTYYAGNSTNGTPLSGAPTAAGIYTVVAAFAGSADYLSASSSPLTFTVTPAPLTITALGQSKLYGSVLPPLTVSYAGLANGDTAASLTTAPTVTTTATSTSPVGIYPLTVAGAVDPNYTISYVVDTLSITPAALVIAADNQTVPYGASLPTLTLHYTGFVNGESAANLTAPPTLATTATASSTIGTYSITASGAADPNYSISYLSGTLAIVPAGLVGGDLYVGSSPGNDTIHLQSLGSGNVDVTLNGIDRGTFNVAGGHIIHVNTPAGNDTLIVNDATLPINLRAGTGTNTLDLSGANTANLWALTGSDAGTVGSVTFTGIANLTSGSGNDTFALATGGSIGKIDGGAGSNTLDYSGFSGGMGVNLQTHSASYVNSFSNVQNFIGSAAPNNTLVGTSSANTWNLTGADAGTVNGATFSAFQYLVGGSGSDSFAVHNGDFITSINGGAGSNTLDYSGYTGGIGVSLQADSGSYVNS